MDSLFLNRSPVESVEPMSSKQSTTKAGRVFLKDQAYDAVKRSIVEGELAPELLLSERSLAERSVMGKAPVRDAIRRLSQEDYLVVTAQQGIVVQALSATDIADTFEARLMIEPQIVAQLAGRLTPHFESLLKKNLDQ